MYQGKIKLMGKTTNDFNLIVNDDGQNEGKSFYEKIRNHKHATAIVEHWNDWIKWQEQRDALLTVIRNTLISLTIMSMPHNDNRVATNDELLKILVASLTDVLPLYEKKI